MNHKELAEDALEVAAHAQHAGVADRAIQLAQAHALLALVEQGEPVTAHNSVSFEQIKEEVGL